MSFVRVSGMIAVYGLGEGRMNAAIPSVPLYFLYFDATRGGMKQE